VFENLIRDGLRGTETSNTLCPVLSEYLLVKLADLVVPAGEHLPQRRSRSSGAASYIATHFRRLRSLEEVAAECDINEAYLCACSAASTTRGRTGICFG
jgi:hypothetical protein